MQELFFFSSRRRHTRYWRDWSSDVCSSDLARSLGTTATPVEARATHRQPKRHYKTRIRMPSKLDPHLATIESWLATEPQITALAIVRRLAEIDPSTFGDKQHSIVQRLLRSLRRK